MKKKHRSIDFTSVRPEKFEHIRSVFNNYARTVYDQAKKHGINFKQAGISDEVFESLTDIMFDSYITCMKATNDSMNKMADLCNDTPVIFPFPIFFKLQTFLHTMQMVEYMMAVDDKKLLSDEVTIDDQCEIYEKTISNGFRTLRQQEYKHKPSADDHFEELKRMVDDDDIPPSEIARVFSSDMKDMTTDDICFVVDKLRTLLTIGKLLPIDHKSKALLRVEEVAVLITDIGTKEIHKRRESN